MSDDPPGLDPVALEPWLLENVRGARAPFAYELIAAGGSNLTYRVTDALGVVRILRRPPVGRTLQRAHEMDREFRVMSGLAGSDVPVPTCEALCGEPTVLDAPFYVMAFVDGTILRSPADSEGWSPNEAATATDSLVDTQVAFHTVDLAATGLSDLGKHADYVPRQLRRWKRQVEAQPVRDLPLVEELHDALAASVPPELAPPGLVHGDYRFDNVIIGPDHRVIAVLDWELCTVGDPIADFAWSLQYWSEPSDDFAWLTDPPTTPVFPGRSEVVDTYATASGFDLQHLDWYEAFCWWKQGCVVEGVHARRRKGQGGGMQRTDVDAIARRVDTLLAGAAARLAAL